MAIFGSAWRKRQPTRQQSAHDGMDAACFAAPNLPPCKAPQASGAHDAGATSGNGLRDDVQAARIAAQRYEAMYGDVTRRDRRYSPVLIMALVFIVGAGAGLSAAKWFGSAPKYRPISAQTAALAPAAITPLDPEGEARALRGIRMSELPYDGREPDSDEAIEQDAAGGKTGPDVATPALMPGPGARPEEPKAAETSPHKTASEREIKALPNAAPAATRQARRTETAPRPATRTAQAGKDKENSREIERIRRQADEELSRKPAVAAKPQRVNAEPSRLRQVSAALASCERRSNIILREHCRWQVCNGMWGKNGCPSYASTNRDPYGY